MAAGVSMRVLFPAVRVRDLEVSLAFYEALGLEAVGRVTNADTRMAMLAQPGEEEVVLELVERTGAGPAREGGFDHLAIQVDDLEVTRRELLAAAMDPGKIEQPGDLVRRKSFDSQQMPVGIEGGRLAGGVAH